jgi:hypothetical protein
MPYAAMANTSSCPASVSPMDTATSESNSTKQARTLSSFACSRLVSGMKAAAFHAGGEFMEVNPAYTSVICAVNYARIKGISIHQGAAYAIARRGLRLSERPAMREALVPVRNGDHVTFALPERNRAKHVWSFWSKVRTNLKAARAVHIRSGDCQKTPAPLSPSMRISGAIWNSTAKSRGARWQNCSANDLGDVPF